MKGRYFIISVLALVMLGGCSTAPAKEAPKQIESKEQTPANQKEKIEWITALNAAAKKSVDRDQLSIFWEYDAASDVDCVDGKLVEVSVNEGTSQTNIDFRNQTAVDTHTALGNTQDGITEAYLNGKSVSLIFHDQDGTRSYEVYQGIQEIPLPYDKTYFNTIIGEGQEDYFTITKIDEEQKTVFLLKGIAEDLNAAQKEERKGEEGYDHVKTCKLSTYGFHLLENRYTIDQDGYLVSSDTKVVMQMDDKQKTTSYHTTYGTYQQLNLGPYEDVLQQKEPRSIKLTE